MADDKFEYLDEEEKDLVQSIESVPVDQLKPASPSHADEMVKAAKAYVRDEQTKMNLRISRSDLDRIKKQAEKEGLKYQSLIKSVLHKYVTGQLVDAKN
ncbi:MAG: antitoxin [Spirochaetaceae bacterium]|nr:antitoxin [Spirochaetaceae bacterium]